jgi:pimeloyl-ACP methyl ester carboxylesterase
MEELTTGERYGAGRDGWATANGVRLHYVEAGTGPLVLLLHGFPECWYTWRRQLATLAAAGYRAVAPDLRGYNLSERPPGVESYTVAALAADVHALVGALGERSAVVVGHDWGGVVAWRLATVHGGVVRALVVVNAPHPERFARALRTARQAVRSWYVAFFQLPWLPEAALRRANFAALERIWRRQPVRPGAYSDADILALKAAIARPGALAAALAYYRAAGRRARRPLLTGSRTISAPTLLIWGEQDAALGVELTEGLERWVPDLRVERLPEASHWVMADAPERLDALLLDFLAEHAPVAP